MTYRILVKHPQCEDVSCVLTEDYRTREEARADVAVLERSHRQRHTDGTPLYMYRFEVIRAADSLAEAAHFVDQELDRNLDEDDEPVAVAR